MTVPLSNIVYEYDWDPSLQLHVCKASAEVLGHKFGITQRFAIPAAEDLRAWAILVEESIRANLESTAMLLFGKEILEREMNIIDWPREGF